MTPDEAIAVAALETMRSEITLRTQTPLMAAKPADVDDLALNVIWLAEQVSTLVGVIQTLIGPQP